MESFRSRNSGYNNRILPCDRVIKQENLKEELKCRICLGVLRNPQECKTCENCFCGDCLDEWLKNIYKCPLKCSEEPKFRNKPHKIIRNMLSDLTLYCKNFSQGCENEIQYDKIQEHEDNCEFEILKCPGSTDGCDIQLIKKEMGKHEKNCQLVPIQCEFCKKQVKRSGIKAHWMYCEEAELSCEFCNGVFKKKNYLIHVNALCEEYIMNCGRCSGTFKRKYKEFHDCIRHLQNCQKTMGEEIQQLRQRLIDKDKKICELENKVFFELSDLKLMVQKLQDQRDDVGTSHSRISSVHDMNGLLIPNEQSQPIIPMYPRWNNNDHRLFQLTYEQNIAELQLNFISQSYNPNDIVFGYVYTECPMVQSNMIEIEIQQNMTTNFIPMYYIIGAVSAKELQLIKQYDNFDTIYYQLSPTCCFLPSFGKSFCDKMKYSLRKIRPYNATNQSQNQSQILQSQGDISINQSIESNETKLEIEELEKNQKQKVVILENEVFVFFGLFCSQATHLLNHKEIKVKIY